MSNHTPGPWTWRCFNGQGYIDGPDETRYNHDGSPAQWAPKLAIVSGLDLSGRWQVKNLEANTRLIAAAPDLLLALKHALREIGWEPRDRDKQGIADQKVVRANCLA